MLMEEELLYLILQTHFSQWNPVCPQRPFDLLIATFQHLTLINGQHERCILIILGFRYCQVL